MPLTRKPSIEDARIGDRKAQIAISNTRQRIEKIELLVSALEKRSNQSNFSTDQFNATITNLNSQIVVLRNQLNALETPDAAQDAIVHVVDDTTLDDETIRLVIVNANGGDIVVTLPSGDIDDGSRTRTVSIYRRDQGSGLLGTNAVTIVTQSGQLVSSGFYELALFDGEIRHFMAVGVEGWVEA